MNIRLHDVSDGLRPGLALADANFVSEFAESWGITWLSAMRSVRGAVYIVSLFLLAGGEIHSLLVERPAIWDCGTVVALRMSRNSLGRSALWFAMPLIVGTFLCFWQYPSGMGGANRLNWIIPNALLFAAVAVINIVAMRAVSRDLLSNEMGDTEECSRIERMGAGRPVSLEYRGGSLNGNTASQGVLRLLLGDRTCCLKGFPLLWLNTGPHVRAGRWYSDTKESLESILTVKQSVDVDQRAAHEEMARLRMFPGRMGMQTSPWPFLVFGSNRGNRRP
ncbi:hypothetical protein NDN08_006660 [Rhodosorus marinus]|uniref:Uncharacterized protein n=1 Tax=Rhodosorus marinus TaxID=101924 RepID=A0AAV8UIC3_9RHOD|nr:hypothetical protein NDN08_006660 [Rhodosorus marinus]